ncbi:hypothetical protein ACHHYP_04202 [Achlya hypogyna]|uniref:Uncharacterized protein n=1 Tax=Achlya hypogyna TaxID=1202772 RepID=A0A1V9Z1T1_ACHHY|nr:hypothetical protein ACHHYP_04202 [Achlya hypogyna]
MAEKRATLHLMYTEEATKARFDRAVAKMQAVTDGHNAALLHKALRYRRKTGDPLPASAAELYACWGVQWHKIDKDKA